MFMLKSVLRLLLLVFRPVSRTLCLFYGTRLMCLCVCRDLLSLLSMSSAVLMANPSL